MYWYEGTEEIARAAAQLSEEERQTVEELRLRANQNIVARGSGWSRRLEPVMSPQSCRDYLARLCGHSLYAAKTNLEQGYFTLDSGCRVGFCGRAVQDGGLTVVEPMFFCIRVAREIKTAAKELIPWVIKDGKALSTLVFSAPGGGKTTALRDGARRLSDGIGCKQHQVAVVDERSELCGCSGGVPTLDVGKNTDVMDGAPKAGAMALLVRSMAPEVIVADELGRPEDAEAVLDAARTGLKLMVSAHGSSLEELSVRPSLARLLEAGVFERFACFEEKRLTGVWDREQKRLFGGTHEERADAGGICVVRRRGA